MRINSLICALLYSMSLGTANGYSNVLPDWQDPELFQKNRLPMSTHFTTDGLKIILDGIWSLRWHEDLDSRDMRFFSLDFDDSEWGSIPVPGMWELNGYGDPLYNNFGFPWEGHYKPNPPFPFFEHNYAGQYRHRVEDMYHYGYVRPQESGTRTELKWIKVTDDNGSGLMISSDVKFSASALPFHWAEMDVRKLNNNQAHSLELKREYTL